MPYEGQELAANEGEITNSFILAAQEPIRNKTVNPGLEAQIRNYAERGSHVARNMLHLMGHEQVYDGVPFEYKKAKIHPPQKVQRNRVYDETKDRNES